MIALWSNKFGSLCEKWRPEIQYDQVFDMADFDESSFGVLQAEVVYGSIGPRIPVKREIEPSQRKLAYMKNKKIRLYRWLLALLLLIAMGVATAEASPIPVNFDKSAVQFVFTKISDTDTNYYPGGTCFTVEVTKNHRPKNVFRWVLEHMPPPFCFFGKSTIAYHTRYFVTAKHVLFDENGNLRPRLYMRTDSQSGGIMYIPLNSDITSGNVRMITHHDKSVDLAAFTVAYPLSQASSNAMAAKSPVQAKLSWLDSSLIVDTNKLKKFDIKEGDDMFFVGLFTPFYGSSENLPICRFGHLSMLPDEPVPWGNEGPQRLYLMETEAFGGNSGSPAFFSFNEGYGARRFQELKEHKPFFSISHDSKIIFAGVVKGYFADWSQVRMVNSTVTPISSQNTSVAVIVPGTYLQEMLFSREENERRNEAFKLLLPKGYK